MPTQLYNLSPALQLMIMGVVVAIGPLFYVWARNRGVAPAKRLQALTLLTLFLTFDLVLFGSFTRLTDSGLGCPDWPGCYGHASPVGAKDHIEAAQTAMPTGPVTHGKAWVEMIHRYLATGVGVLILTLAVASWIEYLRNRKRGKKSISPWWATATLIWVCLQGAFGALTVTMKLFPAIVTLHLVGGLVLLVLLVAQAVQYRHANTGTSPTPLAPASRALVLWSAVLLTIQIFLGGWVSTNYAVLACTDFPTCHGTFWPEMNFSQGFEIWRQLGMTSSGDHVTFPALTAIHYAHRLMAYLVLAILALLWVRLSRVPELYRQARTIGALALLQFLTGLSNVVFDWPLIAAVLHTGGAAALSAALAWTIFESKKKQTHKN